MRTRTRAVVVGLILTLWVDVFAQPSPDGKIGEWAPRQQAVARSAAELVAHPARQPSAWGADNLARWPALDRVLVDEEDALVDQLTGMPMRIGVNRPLAQGVIAMREGRRERDATGRFLWTYQLAAPDARAVRVHFSRFELLGGAELVVADRAGKAVEVYTGRDQDTDQPFWTPPVGGSVVYLEYRSPVADPNPPTIEIDEISHLYRDPLPAEAMRPDGPVPQPQDHVLSCQVDVNCLEVPPVVRDAVGRMVFTTASGTFLCTGTLLADLDSNTYAGYFLTANHCINTPAAAASLAVYWLYQTDACNGIAPSLTSLPRSNGSSLLATSPDSDFSLLRLRDDPNAGQGLVEWTTNAPVGQVVSIHHPRGEHKRVSVGQLTSEPPICGSFPTNRFWYLDWVSGISETGSSGGPLFDSNWRVIGQLFGTCSFNTPGCSNPQDYNVAFGRFALTYPTIASYLTSVIPDDSYEDNDTPGQAALIAPGAHALRLVDFDDYFFLTLIAPAEITATAVFSTAEMNLDLRLLEAGGGVLSVSAGSTGTETVTASVPAGTYLIHAGRTNRWGGNYTLTVAVDPESAVSINHPPAPASPTLQRFCNQGFKVRDTELLGSDPDGDALTLASVSPASAAGGTVGIGNGWVFYTPPANQPQEDSFSYTVQDARGAVGQGVVTVTAASDPGAGLNLSWEILPSLEVQIRGSGIPGRSYTLEYSESPSPLVWQPLGTITADGSGVLEYLDQPPPGAPSRIYRTGCL